MKLTYAVVVEQTPNNYAAYAPDVPGCVSTAKTLDEMLEMIREALILHIELLIEDSEPVPEPRTSINQALAEYDAQVQAEYNGTVSAISTTAHLVEVEVSTLPEFDAQRS